MFQIFLFHLLVCYMKWCFGELQYGMLHNLNSRFHGLEARQNTNISCVRKYSQIHLYKNSVEVAANVSCRDSDNHLIIPLHLKIGAIVYSPYIDFIHIDHYTVANVSGMLIDLIDIMAQKINFSYTVVPIEDFGKQTSPGIWNGGVGHLVNKTIDVFAAPLSVTLQRWEVIDYTPFITSDYIRLFLNNNYTENTMNWMVYWKPINWEVYAVIVATAVLAAGCLKACLQLEFSNWKSSMVIKPSISWILFEGWAILVSQGVSIKPKLTSGKICIVVTSMMALLVLQSYSSQLVSHMTVSKIFKVRTVRDVLDQPNFKIGWDSWSIWQQEFNISENEVEKRIWFRVQKFQTLHIDGPAMLENFLKQESTCYMTSLYNFDISSTICDYYFIDNLRRDDVFIGLQKDSKLTSKFNAMIMNLRESGILKRIHIYYRMKSKVRARCLRTQDRRSSVPAVSLKVAIGIFMPLIIAIPLSIIVSILEKLFWNCK